jgi:RHS repeat-associated protein
VVETYAYTAFGQAAIYARAGRRLRVASAVGNPYFFTGRRLDFETGLYYSRARMYSPNLGRFLQTDPIGYADGINWYAYCGNNPIILTDPFGLLPGLTINPGGSKATAQTYDSTMRWLYTGDWNASDSVYNGAREAAAAWLYETSPVRGAFVSVGKGNIVGASVTGSWTMDSGYGITGVVRTRVGNNNGRLGYERGVSWSQENGFSDTGRVSVTHQNVHGKLTRDGNLRLGINYGVGSGGFVINPSKFGGLINEWKDMLGFGNADGGITPNSGYYSDFIAGGTNNYMK